MRISRIIVVLCVFAIAVAAAIPCFAGSCIVQTPTNCVAGVCNAVFYNSDSTVPATWNLATAVQANCSPAGSGTIVPTSIGPGLLTVNGQATAGATSPVCSWTCVGYSNSTPTAAAVVRFDSSNGLPVELMGFSVE